jgi:hypothetical protein
MCHVIFNSFDYILKEYTGRVYSAERVGVFHPSLQMTLSSANHPKLI